MEALVLGTVALGELWLASIIPWWAAWFFVWAGLSTGFVALAYGLQRPTFIRKETGARYLLWPYLAFARSVARSAQRLGLVERQEIVPGLWVGGWPRAGAPGFAQLDLTAEMPRRGKSAIYRCIPMLDGAAPRPEDWRSAVEQAVLWRQQGHTVLVHCAFGHGRSVAVVIGVLLSEGLVRTPEEAQALVQRVRPRARLSPAQRRFLARAAPLISRPPP